MMREMLLILFRLVLLASFGEWEKSIRGGFSGGWFSHDTDKRVSRHFETLLRGWRGWCGSWWRKRGIEGID